MQTACNFSALTKHLHVYSIKEKEDIVAPRQIKVKNEPFSHSLSPLCSPVQHCRCCQTLEYEISWTESCPVCIWFCLSQCLSRHCPSYKLALTWNNVISLRHIWVLFCGNLHGLTSSQRQIYERFQSCVSRHLVCQVNNGTTNPISAAILHNESHLRTSDHKPQVCPPVQMHKDSKLHRQATLLILTCVTVRQNRSISIGTPLLTVQPGQCG